MSDLARLLESRRTDLGLSRRDLAERSGLSYPYVSQIETGEREPALKALHALAQALELPVERLATAASSSWASPPPLRRPAPPSSREDSRPPSRSSGPTSTSRLVLSVERRLREVPPLERLVVLNEVVARTLAELQE